MNESPLLGLSNMRSALQAFQLRANLERVACEPRWLLGLRLGGRLDQEACRLADRPAQVPTDLCGQLPSIPPSQTLARTSRRAVPLRVRLTTTCDKVTLLITLHGFILCWAGATVISSQSAMHSVWASLCLTAGAPCRTLTREPRTTPAVVQNIRVLCVLSCDRV